MAGWVSLKAVQNLAREWDGYPEGHGFESIEEALKYMDAPTSRWSNYSETRRRVSEALVFRQPDGTRKVRLISRHEGRWYLDWPLPPYRLFDREVVRRAHLALVCDDEEAATLAESLKLGAATTSLNGLAWIARSDWTPLADKDVVILPRNDAEGANYADQVAQRALAVGACSVKIVAIPDLAPGENLVDWMNTAPEDLQKAARLEELKRLIADAPLCEKRPSTVLENPSTRLQCLSEMSSKELSWIVPDVIPTAALTLITGNIGVGKSRCMLDIAARVTRGEAINPEPISIKSMGNEQSSETATAGVCLSPNNPIGPIVPRTTNALPPATSPGAVLLCVHSESVASTIHPRLVASGADLNQVFALHLPTMADDTFSSNSRTSNDSGQFAWVLEQELTRLLSQGIDCRLVIIDPFFISAQSRDTEAAEALFVEQLARLATRFGPAIVLISTTNQFSYRTSRRRQTRGMELLFNAFGSIWNVVRNDVHRQCRWLMPIKTTFCEKPPALGGFIEGGKVNWYRQDIVHGNLPGHAGRSAGPPKSELEHAVDWLLIALSSGRVRSNEIKEEALQTGFSKSTLFRAFGLVNGRATKEKGTGHWYWQLPEYTFGGSPSGGGLRS